MVQTKARALKRAAEAAAKPPSKKKAKAVSEPPVKKKRKGKQARDKAKEAATVSAAYLAPKAAAKGAVAPPEPTPTLRMRGLPFSATTDDISGMRPSDRTRTHKADLLLTVEPCRGRRLLPRAADQRQ
jgi:hypothetical protein